MKRKFGRLAARDERDDHFPMRALVRRIPERELPVVKMWPANGWWGDQRSTSQCVGYAWAHWLEDGPTEQRSSRTPCLSPQTIYRAAQLLDEWPGEDYEGTSVRAGAKALQERRYIDTYLWARSALDVVKHVALYGPVVAGTLWYDGMMEPDRDGLLLRAGESVGGHAYVINGVNRDAGLFRVKNSWGQQWGRGGHAYLRIRDFALLLADGGEACVATEVIVDDAPAKRRRRR
jgi:hypothetical protein